MPGSVPDVSRMLRGPDYAETVSSTLPDYPGERLGRPATGRGSIGRPGRRIGALFIDYAAATVLATAFFGYDQFALPEKAGWTLFAPMIDSVTFVQAQEKLAPGELVRCTVVASDGYDLIARPVAELEKRTGLKILK